MRLLLLGLLVLVCQSANADVFSMPAGLTSLETVVIRDAGNRPDNTGFGAVAYPYRIGKFEVTAAQYVEFLNAKAKSDRDGNLWNNDMDRALSRDCFGCEIRRSGEKGSYTYSVEPGFANRPVSHVSFLDACRFANWLHNGQGDGDTEDGAYTLNGYRGTDGRRVRRNPGARWFVPSEDEWYKAAYYDPQKPGGPGYWDFPTRSDEKPSRDFAGPNAANYYEGSYLDKDYRRTEVGAFASSPSGYGTLDQGGNVYEWTEGLVPPFLRCFWGGSFASDGGKNQRADNLQMSSNSDDGSVGFRIAGALADTPSVTSTSDPAGPGSEAKPLQFPRRPWRNPENGKMFFPLAWFSYNSDEADLDEIAEHGGNLVLYVNSHSNLDTDAELYQNIKRMKRYLDYAHKKGLKVLPQLASWYGAFKANDTAEISRQRKWVEAISRHPALLGYQLYDEPEYRARGGLGTEEKKELADFVEALRRNRDAIRQWDPNKNHMIQVVFNLVPLSSWTAYLPIIDSFQVDRYPCGASLPYFGQSGDWGLLTMAWSMAHGAAALNDMPHLRNPSPCMQGVGLNHTEVGQLGLWRNPLYDETRYMAYSSLTVGAWGVFHWIRNMGMPNSPTIMRNVGRLHSELRQLLPAFEKSYENPPFTVRHNHEGITRDFLTDSVPDITTLTLEDDANYYLIAADNSGLFEDVSFRMKLPAVKDDRMREVSVLNEDWAREMRYESETGEWVIATHKMCFGDVNIYVIPKALKEAGDE